MVNSNSRFTCKGCNVKTNKVKDKNDICKPCEREVKMEIEKRSNDVLSVLAK